MYEGKPMATFKTLDECEAIGKLLELEGVAFRQKVLRKNSNVSKPYAIIIPVSYTHLRAHETP